MLSACVFLAGGRCLAEPVVEPGGLTIQIDFPARIALSRPPDGQPGSEVTQTILSLGFLLENGGPLSLKIGILDCDVPNWYAPGIVFELFDDTGKEVPGGYQATENHGGSSALREIVLEAGKSMRLPYYKGVPFLIRSAGKHTLVATARIQDVRGNWFKCRAKPLTFTVEWAHETTR